MNNKGNILILGLIILNILTILSNILTSNISQVLLFNNMDINMEKMKIKTIQRLDKEYTEECNDFELNENNIYVTATFDGLDYHVEVHGSYHYEMHITYDYVFECIENIEYIYE